MNKWLSEYYSSNPDPSTLQQEIENFMTNFDTNKKEEEKELTKRRSTPDEDGFVLVQRRVKRTDGVEIQPTDKIKKDKVLPDFYKFQQTEAKRDQLVALRKKFEEDKERIAKMKKNRKFRPY